MSATVIRLRPLEREDLRFIHNLDNNAVIMRYWFEEPYEAFVELTELYDKHIHDQMERRFIVDVDGTNGGLVELIEIDYIHRRAEFQIIIDPAFQGLGLGEKATRMALDYAFQVLNLHKIYLQVDSENSKALHIYKKIGFEKEGVLRQEFYINGRYRDAVRMCIFKPRHIQESKPDKRPGPGYDQSALP